MAALLTAMACEKEEDSNKGGLADDLARACDTVQYLGFEDGGFGAYREVLNGSAASLRREITLGPVDSSNLVSYHQIRYDGGTTYRSESNQWPLKSGPKEAAWYGFRIYLPAGYLADSLSEILFQWHGTADEDAHYNNLEPSRSPPLALLTCDGRWVVAGRWDEKPLSTSGGTPEGGGYRQIDIGSHLQDTGRWTQWRFYVYWDYEKNARLHVWKDGLKVVSLDNIRLGYNDKRGAYPQFGLYKWDWMDGPGQVYERGVYHDDIWIGQPR